VQGKDLMIERDLHCCDRAERKNARSDARKAAAISASTS
jgi:hypothetical protein